MQFFALATDYDGTLATDGHIDDNTFDALRRFQAPGRKTRSWSAIRVRNNLSVRFI
ncbi:MAG: hypothetical protein ACM3S2_12650 [Ignavibacteriales bacterium]